jgi:predicted nucleic acid-binding protein
MQVPVVDASVVVDWVAPDADANGPARRLLDRWAADGVSVFAPRLLLEEVANALLTGCRSGRWDGQAADTAFGLLERLPVSLVDDRLDLGAAWDLSRRYDNHPVYDMLYVAVARRLHEPLVTADASLIRRLGSPDFIVLP